MLTHFRETVLPCPRVRRRRRDDKPRGNRRESKDDANNNVRRLRVHCSKLEVAIGRPRHDAGRVLLSSGRRRPPRLATQRVVVVRLPLA